jgi:hypothetical protein
MYSRRSIKHAPAPTMLSKRVIMREWREFVRRRASMTDRYVGGTRDGECPESPPPRPGTPARAPASLSAVVVSVAV